MLSAARACWLYMINGGSRRTRAGISKKRLFCASHPFAKRVEGRTAQERAGYYGEGGLERMTKEVASAPIMPESVIVRARKRCLEKSAGN